MGRYRVAVDYSAPIAVEAEMLEIGVEVSRRISASFPVIDFAKTVEGDWILIECNDGQDSGYAGVKPFPL